MFKKRAPKAPIVAPPPQSDDDDETTSPTITVSIPQDALDRQETSIRSHSAGNSRRSSIDVKHQAHQPSMPWKPWSPQRTGGMRTGGASDPEVQKLAAVSAPSTTTSHVSGTSAGKGASGSKSPSMMLNISGMFSSSPTTGSPGTPGSISSTASQPVEARLWNAELSEPSPLSPAVPRFIPAIAGSGATGSRKMNFGGSRKSFEGYGSPNGGRSLSQATSHSLAQGRPHYQHHQSSSSFSRASSATSRSGSDKSLPKSTKTQSGFLAGASPPNSTREESDNTTFMIPAKATSHVVQDTHRAVAFENSYPRGKLLNGHQHGHEGARKIYREDHGSELRSFDVAEATQPGLYREGLDGLGTDYDDDDNRKRDRRSFSRAKIGSPTFGALLRYPTRFLKARMFSLRYHRRRVHPCVRFTVLILLAGCVCFTTIQLIFYRGSENGRRASFKKAIGRRAKDLQLGGLFIGPTKPKRRISVFDIEAQNYSSQQWELETHNIQGSKIVAKVAEDYMLSKAFSGVMQPTRVIPFYFKASFRDENDDDDFHADDEIEGEHDRNSRPIDLDMSQVTITTLITPDRYGVFLKLVKQYRGPVSVATRIPKGEDQDRHFQELHQFFHDHTILRKYVDLHVIVDGLDLQLNMWRNVARMFARTDYFMMLDVDFHIPSGLKHHLHDDPRMQELLASGSALVIPAFEYKVDKDPKDSKYFPDTKAALIPLLEKGHIHVFHDSFPPGHAATDTPRWMKMKTHAALEDGHKGDHPGDLNQEDYLEMEAEGEKPYKVTKFEPKYEPYIVLKKEGTPWCDERFVGYGANKAACLFEIYVSGVDFWVMPQDFLIHQYHDYPTQNRKNGRTLNKQLFVSFQQEICYTTLTRMIGTGEWYTTKADNLREQCHVFDGFLKSADQMAKDFEERHPDSLIKDPIFIAHGQRRPRVHLSGLDSSTPEIVMVDRPPHRRVQHSDRLADWEINDPSMSSPKGRSWGGIQVKTFYVPSPEEEDEWVFDSQVGGESGHISSPDGQHLEQDRPHTSNLVGTKLDQFREGIIDVDEDDASKFSFPKEGERDYLEQEMERFRKLQEEWLDRGPSDLDPDLTGGGGEHSQPERESRVKDEYQPNHPFRRDPNESFEDAARRLEERFRKLLEEQ